ncbi:MAG TPA: electron transfer flavoprotein subunit alpha/FixB family protein [Dehalococcoidia bacterium]|nr:electron transfer flavoprotein subunit alpha/FixB family protein [Dehalococcoidia bacterium]
MGIPLYGPQEASGLWVFLEQESGELEGVSRELLGKGRELASGLKAPLKGLLLGQDVQHAAEEAVACGADEVLVADDPRLAVYTTDAYAKVAGQAVLQGQPDIFLLGATPNGRDLAGRLAVRLRTGLTADCTDLAIEEGTGLLLGQVTGFGGGIVATIKCERHRPQMATVRPGIFPLPSPERARKGTLRPLAVELGPEEMRVQVVERAIGQGEDITQAQYLIVGGRGVEGNFRLLEELAELLKGQVGATRVAVDHGWVGRDIQIGQTGYVTRPKLAIVCGASGALQFTVGIQDAGAIVAINTDAEAPIFEQADYCLTYDLFQVLPPLIEAVKRAMAGG